MAKQKDEIKVSLDVHQGLALTCLVMPEIDIKIDVKFEYEAAKADHKDEKSAIKEALATAVREQRVKHQEKLKKAEATLKKIAEGGGTRTAAEAILTQLNAGVLNSLRTKFPTLVKTTVGEEVKKIKSLPGLKATTTAPVPSKEYALAKPYLKSLIESSESSAPRKKIKGKIGPLQFNLLDGAPSATYLALPPKVLMKVEIDYVFESTDVVEMSLLQGVASEVAEKYRADVKRIVTEMDAELGKAVQANNAEEAEDIIAAVNRTLELIETESAEFAQKAVKKAVKEMKNRQVDLVVYRVEAVTDVVFSVVKIATAAKDVFDKPPGWNLVSPIIKIATNTAKIVGVIRTAINDVWTVRQRLIEGLQDLESKRLLHLKTWTEKSKTEVVKDVFYNVKEAVLDDVGSAEKLLQAFSAKATALLNQSKKMGTQLTQLLEIQSEASSEGADALADAIAPLVETIPEMIEQFDAFEKEEDEYEKALALIQRDASKAVVFVKWVKEQSELLEPVGVIERGCKGVIKVAQEVAKS